MEKEEEMSYFNISIQVPPKPEKIEIVVRIGNEQTNVKQPDVNVKFEGPVIHGTSADALYRSMYEIARENIERR